MLTIRPNCEYCDIDLLADAPDAMICSYECTFCANCVETRLHNVCPNCGGGFEKRPIRPKNAYRNGTGLGNAPASAKRMHLKHDREKLAEFIHRLKDTPPRER
ncbi:DUF1272 domain-containing protein [Hoeflea prorocentri]|uniref:DUF1272 domain-containing protein n=1 Tax=Hoeflea prorocentri TaxID=1922333 RepID=A0A9X3UIL6_9HYPH|nr:DUF1272 domain-containing protein [Hoeflea prorocentri]MCY6379295.1 DUF1272 domain-containing protein [Hoeflea prorocentri]MDA5397096.1 DUF1272 domain-containing protein [Hoeflea prorocentri]